MCRSTSSSVSVEFPLPVCSAVVVQHHLAGAWVRVRVRTYMHACTRARVRMRASVRVSVRCELRACVRMCMVFCGRVLGCVTFSAARSESSTTLLHACVRVCARPRAGALCGWSLDGCARVRADTFDHYRPAVSDTASHIPGRRCGDPPRNYTVRVSVRVCACVSVRPCVRPCTHSCGSCVHSCMQQCACLRARVRAHTYPRLSV